MFCPHCGSEMIDTDGVLRCARTGMPLSKRLEHGLAEVFLARVRAPRPAAIKLRHPFFCPGCGVQMTPDYCPRCGLALDEFAHDIVELHPHIG